MSTNYTEFETSAIFQAWLNEAIENGSYDLEKVRRQITEQMWNFMQEKALNKTEVAKACGFHQSYISRLLKGDNFPSIESLVKLAKEFDCELEITFKRK